MAKQRKSKAPKQSSSKIEEIPEDEQWRIIEQSGVLKNIPRSPPSEKKAEEEIDDEPFSPFCTEIYNAILLIIPFSSLYVMMDMYVLWKNIDQVRQFMYSSFSVD